MTLGTQLLALVAVASPITLSSPLQASTFKVLYTFPDSGTSPLPMGGLLFRGGYLYGTTEGTGKIFKIDPATGTETNLNAHNNPKLGVGLVVAVTPVHGYLYTSTEAGGPGHGGVVFKVSTQFGYTRTVSDFYEGEDGESPGRLTYANGRLYGSTTYGGAPVGGSGAGTLFAIDPVSGTRTKLYDFQGMADGSQPNTELTYVNGKLYGTTRGTVFAFDIATGTLTTLHSFRHGEASPSPGVTYHNGFLYGATLYGGKVRHGTLFRVNTGTGGFDILYDFDTQGGGIGPKATPIYSHGYLYGTTEGGGANGEGTVYQFDPSTKSETTLHSFVQFNIDGVTPSDGVIDVNGTLYGETWDGGTIYAVTP